MRAKHSPHGFTLIELLVVIAIIIILAALLLPALGRVRDRAKLTKARQEVAQIDTALRGYLQEYRRPFGNIAGYGNWPGNQNTVESTINGIQMESQVVEMLSGVNVNGANPLRLPFVSLPPNALDAGGRFIDPWGNPYKFMFDYNDNGVVEIAFSDFDGSTNLLGVPVAVWSRGPAASDRASDGGIGQIIRSW